MRILLVTSTDQLSGISSILNPELEYSAIIVDEVEPAKKFCMQIGLSKDLIYPLYELKECCRDFYYDYLLCVTDDRTYGTLPANVYKCTLTRDKFVCLRSINRAENFLVERTLRYYKAHAAEFEMFATGMSYTEHGIDPRRFTKKLFNFGRGTQDLYYDNKVVNFAILCVEGHRKLRYALIGLSMYTFHFDQSRLYAENFRLLQYAIAFKDLHNFLCPLKII